VDLLNTLYIYYNLQASKFSSNTWFKHYRQTAGRKCTLLQCSTDEGLSLLVNLQEAPSLLDCTVWEPLRLCTPGLRQSHYAQHTSSHCYLHSGSYRLCAISSLFLKNLSAWLRPCWKWLNHLTQLQTDFFLKLIWVRDAHLEIIAENEWRDERPQVAM